MSFVFFCFALLQGNTQGRLLYKEKSLTLAHGSRESRAAYADGLFAGKVLSRYRVLHSKGQEAHMCTSILFSCPILIKPSGLNQGALP
jgi:hypothetical protein